VDDIKTYRIDLKHEELEYLKIYTKTITEEENSIAQALKKKVNNAKEIIYSSKRNIAAKRATEARTTKAKAKIQNAINILRMENKKMTHYSIAMTAKVSYLTVKKYITLDEIKQINQN